MKISKRKQRSRKGGFKQGNTYRSHPSRAPSSSSKQTEEAEGFWIPRLTPEEYSLVVKEAPGGGIYLPDEEGISSAGHLLRPKPGPDINEATIAYLEGDGNNEMRFLHREKTIEMFNDCIMKHSSKSDCAMPQFKLHREIKWGLGWKESLACKNCDFVSKEYKLYDIVESESRGPKQAKPNLAFQIGLQECPMGNTKARVLLASTNTPPPCLSSLQKTSVKAAKLTSAVVEKDLKKRRSNLKKVYNLRRGAKKRTIVNVGLDTRYNSSCGVTGRNKFGQNASQALGMAIENQTDKKQIVAVYLENKLCYQGAWLRAKGYKVSCPGGHEGCTATSEDTQPLSEFKIGKELGDQLALEDIMVKYCVTDGDSRSALGMQSAMSKIDPLWKVVRQADTTHLGVSLFKHAYKACYSEEMFPGTSTRDTTEQRKMLARDLKHRCGKIFKMMYNTYKGDMDKVASNMGKAIEATVKCYSGDCSDCKKYSVVCPGGGRNWRATSHDLKLGNITTMYPTDMDRHILRELLRFFLGSSALELIGKNMNTNKNEAANRGISANNPKNVKCSRTGNARVLSAVGRMNKGAGKHLIDSLEGAGCAISKGGYVSKAVHQMQLRHSYQRAYQKRANVKAAKRRRIKAANERHVAAKRHREASSGSIHQYLKGQLDPPFNLRGRSGTSSEQRDHSYFKHH